MHFFATPTVLVDFDKLPDDAIAEIAAFHKLTGNRQMLLKGLQDIIHRSTYDDLDPLIQVIKKVVVKHDLPQALQCTCSTVGGRDMIPPQTPGQRGPRRSNKEVK